MRKHLQINFIPRKLDMLSTIPQEQYTQEPTKNQKTHQHLNQKTTLDLPNRQELLQSKTKIREGNKISYLSQH